MLLFRILVISVLPRVISELDKNPLLSPDGVVCPADNGVRTSRVVSHVHYSLRYLL